MPEQRIPKKLLMYYEQLEKFGRYVHKRATRLALAKNRSHVSNRDYYKVLWKITVGNKTPKDDGRIYGHKRRLMREIRVRHFIQKEQFRAALTVAVAAAPDAGHNPQGEAPEAQEGAEQNMDVDPGSPTSVHAIDMQSVRSDSPAPSAVPMSLIEGGRRDTTSTIDMASVELGEENSGSAAEPANPRTEGPDVDQTPSGSEEPDSGDGESDSGSGQSGDSAPDAAGLHEGTNENTVVAERIPGALETIPEVAETIPQNVTESSRDAEMIPQNVTESSRDAEMIPQNVTESSQDADESSRGGDESSRDADVSSQGTENAPSDTENAPSDTENAPSDTENTAPESGESAPFVSMAIRGAASVRSESPAVTARESPSNNESPNSECSHLAVYGTSSGGSQEDTGSSQSSSTTNPCDDMEAVVEQFRATAIQNRRRDSPKRKASELNEGETSMDCAESYMSPRKKRVSGTSQETSPTSSTQVPAVRPRSNTQPSTSATQEGGECSTSRQRLFQEALDDLPGLPDDASDFDDEETQF